MMFNHINVVSGAPNIVPAKSIAERRTESMKSRTFLTLAIGALLACIVVTMAIAWHRHDTPKPEADVQAIR
jgi:hypothetical protein